MKDLLDWIDQRTGLSAAARKCLDRPLPGRVCCCKAWPSTIVFAFCVQAITGFFLWMYYSPGAQTAWESVYYLQHEVLGGRLLQAVHHWSAQVLLVLIGIYLLQTIVTGAYRAPRELVFWAAMLMGLLCLGLMLTGDLLAWDQNSYASTKVRVNFLTLLPGIGDGLVKLAAGGPAFGHLTLTRFLTLHVGLFSASFLVLLILHGWFARRTDAARAETAEKPETAEKASSYWPCQALCNSVACLIVLAVVLLLAFWEGVSLGSPADPASSYAAARPEWAFLGLYEFSHLFPGSLAIVPIFVIPGLLVCVFLAMPWIGRSKRGHVFNVGLTGLLLAGIVVLSCISVWKDGKDENHQAALAKERQLADRAVELARAKGIPTTGAVTLLANDPKTRGPILFEGCAGCHNYSVPDSYNAPDGQAITTEEPSAPELYRFARREWIEGFMDPKKIGTAKFYGNTRFAAGVMVRYVQGRFSELKKDDRQAIIAALSAEARVEVDKNEAELIAKGRQLIAKQECARCHRFHGHGALGGAPDLTGYGSRAWIAGIVADPSHPWFYGPRNDRMPAYHASADEPGKNALGARELEMMADWLRGEWYEESRKPSAGDPKRPSIDVLAYQWTAGWTSVAPIFETGGPHTEARRLFRREHCALCHDCTGAAGGDVAAADPTAPDLGRFASREWIAGLLDPEQIKTRKYFGNSRFRNGAMTDFVEETFTEMEAEDEADVAKLVMALSAEARLPSQKEQDAGDAAQIDEGRELLTDVFGCTDCHKFRGKGAADAPDLTGYGSPEWIAAIVSDPQQKRFYGDRNDGMPSYRASAEHPARNLLTPDQIQRLAAWLRGEPGGE